METEPASLFDIARNDLAALAPGGSPGDDDPPTHEAVTLFLSGLADIGLAYGDDPNTSDDLEAFAGSTAGDINLLSVPLSYYPGDLLITFSGVWEADEWRLLCQRRSGLQFFFDIYRSSDAWSVVETVLESAASLDAFIRERGMIEGYLTDKDIDPAIPRSHWWWRLPD